ncbi:MAG TPA: hypothetical protein VGF36_11240 [Rhodopila sp.]
MSYPAGKLAGMKFLRLVQGQFDSVSLAPRPPRLAPPWSLRVIEGQTGAGRKDAVRFSVRIRAKR